MPASALLRPRPEHSPSDLLRAYLPGSFLYSSPRGSLLADGVHAVVASDRGSRARAAAEALGDAAATGHPDPILVGAIGFGPDAASSLVVPSVVRRAVSIAGHGPSDAVGSDATQPAPDSWSVRHRPEVRDYAAAVERALELIEEGPLRKVVLARCVELTGSRPVDLPRVLERLARADPAAHAFAVDVSAPGDSATRTLFGASPELLVSRHGELVVSNPLAGSSPRAKNSAQDTQRAQALIRSEKDLREHAFVVDQVADVLRRYCVDVDVPAAPSVIGTATMWHLSSRITGRLVDPSVSALTLAEALHPTPAVCGVPLDEARSAIASLERVDRGYYSGLVGWSAANGDGEWVITIRSAEAYARTLRLFAGAGVVRGSDPEAELAETDAKLRTLLRAIGTHDVLG